MSAFAERRILALLFVCWAGVASALDMLWQLDTGSAARSLPVAIDYNDDGSSEVVFTARFDGVLHVVSAQGARLVRLARGRWLEGSAAVSVSNGSRSPLLTYLDSAGVLALHDLGRGKDLQIQTPGSSRIGVSPCLADINGDGMAEVVCAQRAGDVIAFDLDLTPLWHFSAGAPVDSSPSVAPVFAQGAGVYVQATDGVLHCISGRGLPLWRFEMANAAPRYPSLADPLVAQLAGRSPWVFISDAQGWLYAVDAVSGNEVWRVRAGSGALGSPALFDVAPDEDLEILTLDERGELAVIGASGELIAQVALPEGEYVSRPLVADVDADGQMEIIAATGNWELVIAGLDGEIEQRVELRGNAREGAAMADLNGDSLLELIAATDCGAVYCFATRARTAWAHPRGGSGFPGAVGPFSTVAADAQAPRARRGVRIYASALNDFVADNPFGAAAFRFDTPSSAANVVAVLQDRDMVVGAAYGTANGEPFVVPCVRKSPDGLSLNVAFLDSDGEVVASVADVTVSPPVSTPVQLTDPGELESALAGLAAVHRTNEVWRLPVLAGRNSWHVARFMPERWQEYGIGGEPFISEAISRVWAPAPDQVLSPEHPAWPMLRADSKPFFVMNDYFAPKEAYPVDLHAAIVEMAGERFLGYPVHEWAYAACKGLLEQGESSPGNRQRATSALRGEFTRLLNMCHKQVYAGQGYCLFHHQAFAWGAPLGYAEVGENIPCAPLQFAFIRGASRQYGVRPWGVYISNWFRGAVADTRHGAGGQSVVWSKPDIATGPACGHSASLEHRLEMAGYLAGATFVHHESDGHNGSIFVSGDASGGYGLSPFGQAMRAWYDYTSAHPHRGVPYAPIAFMLDFDHGWRPREDIYGIWPQGRAEKSMEAVFADVYPWGGGLDFEQGYLANGPYGDIFDVLTDDATSDTLRRYGVVWPLGTPSFDAAQRQMLADYVAQGGVLVVDRANSEGFPVSFLGARFRRRPALASQMQTALGAASASYSPYRYYPMDLSGNARPLAWTGDGEPVAAWSRFGKGVVIVSATHHWLDERNTLLPLVPAIMQNVARAFLPVEWAGDVEMLLNRTSSGWIVGLINNSGIRKTPTGEAEVNQMETRDCVLRFTDRVPVRFTPRIGEFTWSNRARGLCTSIAPGGIAVVEARFGERRAR